MKYELKPCPFCGSKAQPARYETKTGEVWYGVRCSNYDCIGNDISPEFGLETRAVNWWNLRSKDDGYTAQKWIPVTERLPEDDLVKDSKVKLIKVLGYYKTSMGVPVVRTQIRQKGRRYTSDSGRWCWAKSDPITHWMPLPEPPKEVE